MPMGELMTPTPELDQVAAARRRMAAHVDFPRTYWVLYGIVLVLLAGVPVWTTVLPTGAIPYLLWAIAAVGLASAVYVRLRRRRTGVYPARRISAYPSAVRLWALGLVLTVVGFFGLQALVDHGLRGVAIGLVPVVAAAVFAVQWATRRAMRRDVEAGRVVP
jgi:hypothetical protein